MSAEGDCGKVVRCDKANSGSEIRLAELKCPQGLAFDLHLQTCDWKANVKGRIKKCKCRKARQVNRLAACLPHFLRLESKGLNL